MLIYSHKITPRVRYIFNVLFGDMLGLETRFESDKNAFANSDEPKFSYSHSPVGNEPYVKSQGLLHETGVKDQNVNVLEDANGKYFYSISSDKSIMKFDVFAASFFLLSRYEECLPHIRDQYNRFEAKESLAYKNKFLTQPVVDQWVIKLGEILQSNYPELKFKKREYKFLSTIDIDNAYAYKHKGFFRTAGAYGRSLATRNFKEVVERTNVLLGRQQDPYDTYDFQLDIQQQFNVETLYFFLLADYGVNDKNVPHYNQKFQSLIKHLADYAKVGIHPGFNSNQKVEKLKTEKKRLEKIIHRSVVKSRQHFLILHVPHTYQNLIDNDILEDHSMGYAAHTGFRAGTCTPYRYYDLDLETTTELIVHPFTMMEATLKYYMKLSPEESKAHITELIKTVKSVNGTFISLWHNETLSNVGLWAGWRDVFTHMVKEAQQ
ncbi:MAG: polysaccharide deacetylase family protein [Flavobacteriales bacterium]